MELFKCVVKVYAKKKVVKLYMGVWPGATWSRIFARDPRMEGTFNITLLSAECI
jgi:hypothetical protein